MAEEVVKILKIETEGAAKTVKDLKNEITSLRDALVNTTKGSEEYNKIVEKLVDDQKKLTDVMRVGKDEMKAAAGSYNALQNEMAALRKVWKETTDVAKRDEIGKRINEINTQLKEMDASIGNNQRKVGSYEEALKSLTVEYSSQRQELAAMKKALDNLDPSTKEYEQAFTRAAEITHNLQDRQEMLKYASADLGDQLSNIRGIASNLAAGFSAASAAIGLFGGETEDVQKAMLKVQQAMAIVQGLEGLDGFIKRTQGLSKALGMVKVSTEEATVAQKGLNAAIKSNPIGFILGLLAILIANFKTIKEWITKLVGGTESFNKAMNKMKVTISGVANVMKNIFLVPIKEAINYFSTLATVMKDVFTFNWDKIGEDIKKGVGNSVDIVKNGFDIQNNYAQAASKKSIEIAEEDARKKAELAKDDADNYIKDMEAKEGADWKYTKEGQAAYKKYFDNLLKMYKKDSKEYKEAEREKWKFEADTKQHNTKTSTNKDNTKTDNKENDIASNAKKFGLSVNADYKQLAKDFYNTQLALAEDYLNQRALIANKILGESVEKAKKKLEEGFNWEQFQKQMTDGIKAVDETSNFFGFIEGDLDYVLDTLDAQYEELKQYLFKQKEVIKKQWQKDSESYAKESLKKTNDVLIKSFQTEAKRFVNAFQTQNAIDKEKLTLEVDFEISTGNDWESFNGSGVLVPLDKIKKEEIEFNALTEAYKLDLNTLERELHLYEDTIKYVDENGLLPSDSYDEAKEKLQEVQNEIVALTSKYYSDQRAIKQKYYSQELKDIDAHTNSLLQSTTVEYEKLLEETGYIIPQKEKELLDALHTIRENGLNEQLEVYKKIKSDEKATADERLDAERMIQQTMAMIEEEELAHTIQVNEQRKAVYSEWVGYTEDSINAIGDLFGNLANYYEADIEEKVKNGKITEEQAKKEFERVKDFQIAQATVTMIAGVAGALASPFLSPADSVLPTVAKVALAAVTSSAQLIAGLAQIKQIKNTQYGGSSNVGSVTYATPNMPDYEPTYTQNITSQKETEDLKNALATQPIWVSVSDIDRAQNRVQVRENESSF